MKLEEAETRLDTGVFVRCDGCSHNWRHKRGNDLRCRYCGNVPEEVDVHGSLAILEVSRFN